ncbi:nuclear transport factor 2 family protein [Nocardia xishanensis]
MSDPEGADRAHQVATEFAEGLQRAGDADEYDSAFAADILWGSPFGASVTGFAELNAIHHRLMAAKVAPPSRFEVVAALAPAPGVVVTQIRRQAADGAGFSEMAMYVLAERDGRWWLAAAQNTPVGVSPLDSAGTDRPARPEQED